jgi:hypothetical protein
MECELRLDATEEERGVMVELGNVVHQASCSILDKLQGIDGRSVEPRHQRVKVVQTGDDLCHFLCEVGPYSTDVVEHEPAGVSHCFDVFREQQDVVQGHTKVLCSLEGGHHGVMMERTWRGRRE